jgi:DNA-binding SARP family transcriptional activator
VARKAREVQQAIHRAGLPRLRLQTLGGFRLWRGDEEVADSEWGGHQPQLLLKALLARGATRVPQDLLIEDLWPEVSPQESERRFKVNLHRLRKTLEPRLVRSLGSSYLHLQANFLSLDKEIYVDVEDFLTLCQEGERLEAQGEGKQAQLCFQQAVDLYGGDFLAEERYISWVERKRLELQSRYLEVLQRLAGLHVRRGHVRAAIKCYKQVISTDPLAESAYQKLMLLYDQRGRRTAALRVYRDCQEAMREGLDAHPDRATTAIYRKILET